MKLSQTAQALSRIFANRNLDLPAEASAKENDFTVIGVMSREGPSTEFDSEENITSVVFKINTLTANIDI